MASWMRFNEGETHTLSKWEENKAEVSWGRWEGCETETSDFSLTGLHLSNEGVSSWFKEWRQREWLSWKKWFVPSCQWMRCLSSLVFGLESELDTLMIFWCKSRDFLIEWAAEISLNWFVVVLWMIFLLIFSLFFRNVFFIMITDLILLRGWIMIEILIFFDISFHSKNCLISMLS